MRSACHRRWPIIWVVDWIIHRSSSFVRVRKASDLKGNRLMNFRFDHLTGSKLMHNVLPIWIESSPIVKYFSPLSSLQLQLPKIYSDLKVADWIHLCPMKSIYSIWEQFQILISRKNLQIRPYWFCTVKASQIVVLRHQKLNTKIFLQLVRNLH